MVGTARCAFATLRTLRRKPRRVERLPPPAALYERVDLPRKRERCTNNQQCALPRRANQLSRENLVHPPYKKYSASPVGQISATSSPHPASQEGRMRNRHETRGGMRWTRRRARRARQCVRRNRVVLTPRRWRQVPGKLTLLRATVARKPGHRGERAISRKTIARGRPECFR
jgi:hypothetical protein